MKPFKWIFFDLGWTLVDETHAHEARLYAVCRQLAKIGRRHSVEQLVKMCEQAASRFASSPFRGMLERLGLSDNQRASLMASVRYMKEEEVLYPGVPDLLSTLSKGFRLGVIANQPQGAEGRLIQWGIGEHFSLIVTSHEYGLAKPDPQIFAAALSDAQCEAKEALMIGDRLDNDIGPAKAQGMKTMRVLQGFSRFQEPRSQHEVPDFSISGLKHLLSSEAIQLAETKQEP